MGGGIMFGLNALKHLLRCKRGEDVGFGSTILGIK